MSAKDFITIIRPVNCTMMFVATFIGATIEFNNFEIISIIAGVVAFLIGAGGNVVNDYFDIEIDKINAPKRPIASGKISKNVGLVYSIILFILGISFSLFLNYICIFITILNSSILILYAKTLKKKELIGNISVAYLMSSLFVFGGFAAGSINIVIFLGFCAFFAGVDREITKDIEDIEGDQKSLAKTLPIKRGNEFSAKIANLNIIFAIIISPLPYILGYLNILYLIFVIFADFGFILSAIKLNKDSSSDNAKKVELKLKLSMFLALIAYILGII